LVLALQEYLYRGTYNAYWLEEWVETTGQPVEQLVSEARELLAKAAMEA
jgi:hypothetical protein